MFSSTGQGLTVFFRREYCFRAFQLQNEHILHVIMPAEPEGLARRPIKMHIHRRVKIFREALGEAG